MRRRGHSKTGRLFPNTAGTPLVHDKFLLTNTWKTFLFSFLPLPTGSCHKKQHESLDRSYSLHFHQDGPYGTEMVHTWAWGRAREEQHVGPRRGWCPHGHPASLGGQQDCRLPAGSAGPVLGDIRGAGGSLPPSRNPLHPYHHLTLHCHHPLYKKRKIRVSEGSWLRRSQINSYNQCEVSCMPGANLSAWSSEKSCPDQPHRHRQGNRGTGSQVACPRIQVAKMRIRV